MSMLTEVEVQVYRSDNQMIVPNAYCKITDLLNYTNTYEGYTDDSGSWVLPTMVMPSQYSLFVQKENYVAYDRIVAVAGGYALLVVSLVPVSSGPVDDFSLVVSVKDDHTGDSLYGVWVRVIHPYWGTSVHFTDAGGIARWDYVPGGTWTVSVMAEGYTAPSDYTVFMAEPQMLWVLAVGLLPDQYVITLQTGLHGTTNPAPGTQVLAYSDDYVTISADPDQDYQFKEWQIVSGTPPVGWDKTASPITFNPLSSMTVKALFEVIPLPNEYTVTVTADLGGTTIDPPGSHSVLEGDWFEVTAVPDPGYYHTGWLVNSVNHPSSDPQGGTLSVQILGPTYIIARFGEEAEGERYLTIQTTKGGLPYPAPGVYTYYGPTQVGITADVVDEGYVFSHWILDGARWEGTSITVTMNINHNVTAVFARADGKDNTLLLLGGAALGLVVLLTGKKT